jgi:hypothetical protein
MGRLEELNRTQWLSRNELLGAAAWQAPAPGGICGPDTCRITGALLKEVGFRPGDLCKQIFPYAE